VDGQFTEAAAVVHESLSSPESADEWLSSVTTFAAPGRDLLNAREEDPVSSEGIVDRMSGLNRQWTRTEGSDVWMLFATESPDWAAFESAVSAANALAFDRTSSAMGQFPAPVPSGYVVDVTEAASKDALAQWVGDCAKALQERGLSGEISAPRAAPRFAILTREAPDLGPEGWPDPSTGPSRSGLTAFLAWTLDLAAMAAHPIPQSHWNVPVDATQEIADTLSGWALLREGTVVLHHDLFAFQASEHTAAPGLARAVTTTGWAGVDSVNTGASLARHVRMGPCGSTVAQVLGDDLSVPEQLDALRTLLIALPEHTQHGFVRPAPAPVTGDLQVFDTVPAPPGASEATFRYHPHLAGRYVRDAHGIQVLRGRHLEHARDLSRWRITPLGHDRHLVEASDLEPWYADKVPDPGVLEQARRDFGDLILTDETAHTHPPPSAPHD
jgi:hypothetical protein